MAPMGDEVIGHRNHLTIQSLVPIGSFQPCDLSHAKTRKREINNLRKCKWRMSICYGSHLLHISRCSYPRMPTLNMESIRSRRHDVEGGLFRTCDCTSYYYFSTAIVLVALGTLLTVLALDDPGDHNMFSNFGHMWLIGPIFISSGLMVAVKTILYLRKKNLMALIIRQRALLRELQSLQLYHHQQQQLVRNPSVLTLPPAYDLVVNDPDHNSNSRSCLSPSSDPGSRSIVNRASDGVCGLSPEEPPPPSYDEAMLLGQRRGLLLQQQSVIIPAQESIENNNTKNDPKL